MKNFKNLRSHLSSKIRLLPAILNFRWRINSLNRPFMSLTRWMQIYLGMLWIAFNKLNNFPTKQIPNQKLLLASIQVKYGIRVLRISKRPKSITLVVYVQLLLCKRTLHKWIGLRLHPVISKRSDRRFKKRTLSILRKRKSQRMS